MVCYCDIDHAFSSWHGEPIASLFAVHENAQMMFDYALTLKCSVLTAMFLFAGLRLCRYGDRRGSIKEF